MRTLTLAALALVTLALAAGAAAGGWATVGVAPLPSGGEAVWTPTITVLQHGRTPFDGASPVVTIRNAATGEIREIAAAPTGNAGEYAARVEWPSRGVWSFEIRDGVFPQTHTYRPVEVVAGGRGATSAPWTAGGAAVVAGALALLLLGRRLRPLAAPAPSRKGP